MASTDILSAIHVAIYGKKLTTLEYQMLSYCQSQKEFKEVKCGKFPDNMPSHIKPKHLQALEEHAKRDRDALCKILMDAIDIKLRPRLI